MQDRDREEAKAFLTVPYVGDTLSSSLMTSHSADERLAHAVKEFGERIHRVGYAIVARQESWEERAKGRELSGSSRVQHDDFRWAANRFEEGSMAAWYENGGLQRVWPERHRIAWTWPCEDMYGRPRKFYQVTP